MKGAREEMYLARFEIHYEDRDLLRNKIQESNEDRRRCFSADNQQSFIWGSSCSTDNLCFIEIKFQKGNECLYIWKQFSCVLMGKVNKEKDMM